MTPYDQKTQEVIAEIRNYNVSINREQKLELFTDGLCENPGAMHIGLFARQGNNCLFTRHTFVGHGTCNEAEYIAVKTGLTGPAGAVSRTRRPRGGLLRLPAGHQTGQ